MGNINKSFDFQAGEIMLFDKPLDWTSFDVVNKVRFRICKKLGIKKLKVGHAGTLDPKATGLMILCTGKKTKQIEAIQAGEKEYIATIKLGATTASFDTETEEDKTYPVDHIDRALIEETLEQFKGVIEQVPPIFSAVKIKGQRAFEMARKGEKVEIKARKVEIKYIEIEQFSNPELILKIGCSKGTYIRSMANDIGAALSSGAYLTGLIRTKVGPYVLEDAYKIDDLEDILSSINL